MPMLRCGVCGNWTARNKRERDLGRVCLDCDEAVQQATVVLLDTDGIRAPQISEIDKLNTLDL